MHILVVDDKESIIEKVCELLAEFPCTIETACNGLDALEKAQKTEFDLYIVDHLMPVMNGIKFVKNLKAKDELSVSPILFMTTQGIDTLDSIAESKYFDAVISKPIDENLFFNVINQLFPQNTQLRSI